MEKLNFYFINVNYFRFVSLPCPGHSSATHCTTSTQCLSPFHWELVTYVLVTQNTSGFCYFSSEYVILLVGTFLLSM